MCGACSACGAGDGEAKCGLPEGAERQKSSRAEREVRLHSGVQEGDVHVVVGGSKVGAFGGKCLQACAAALARAEGQLCLAGRLESCCCNEEWSGETSNAEELRNMEMVRAAFDEEGQCVAVLESPSLEALRRGVLWGR